MKMPSPDSKIFEFIRFCIVGGIATMIHYGVYLGLIIIHVDNEFWTNIAYTIGYLISWCCNLWLTAHFTFRTDISAKRGVGFAISHGINYLLHLGFLNFFLWIGIAETIAPIPVFICVIPINFILVRTVFKNIK